MLRFHNEKIESSNKAADPPDNRPINWKPYHHYVYHIYRVARMQSIPHKSPLRHGPSIE